MRGKLKALQDLESGLRIYARYLEEEGILDELHIIEQAIEIVGHRHAAFQPNQFRAKRTLLGAMYDAPGPLSVDALMLALQEARLVGDRRTTNVRLSEMKRKGEVINPDRGFWTVTSKGRKYVERARAIIAAKKEKNDAK